MTKRRIVSPKTAKKPAVELDEDEEIDSEAGGIDDEDDEEDPDEEPDSEEEGFEEDEEEPPSEVTKPSVRTDPPLRPRGRRRPARMSRQQRELEEETAIEVIDYASWPGTAEAAKLVGRHPSTIKLWRQQGKIRAQIDESGVWRHNPDDLLALTEAPEPQDPATLLASGLSSIVAQGERAGERLIEMSTKATKGLETACDVLGEQLQAAYARISELEKKLADVLDRSNNSLEASFRHERLMKKLDHEQSLELEEKKSASAKLMGLLEVIGPIGASIAARVVGNEQLAAKVEERAVEGSGIGGRGLGGSRLNTAELPIETRIADAMGRLKGALCELDEATAKAFRLMLPEEVGLAVYTVRTPNVKDSDAGEALAVITKAGCTLPKPQFEQLAPIAPAGVVAVLVELRQLINEEK